MKILKIINPDNVSEADLFGWRFRRTVRAVVFDDENKIGLLYIKNRDYYKLAGGGIEEGEDIEAALSRECLEELGVQIKIVDEIGCIIEFRNHDSLHQTSYCYITKVNSQKGNPCFSEREKSFGYEVLWVKIDDAIKLFNQIRKSIDDHGKNFSTERDLCVLNEVLK